MTLLRACAIAGLLALAPTVGQAQVVTRFTTYMHSGPGLQFAVTDEIPNRTQVAPETCQAGWCRINLGGVPGWVQQKNLTAGSSTAEPQSGERPIECMDFARTGWPDKGQQERVCIFAPRQAGAVEKPAG